MGVLSATYTSINIMIVDTTESSGHTVYVKLGWVNLACVLDTVTGDR